MATQALKEWFTLGHLEGWTDGTSRGFDPMNQGKDAVFIVRIGQNLHAWHNDCPHVQGAPLAWRRDAYLSADGQRIVCAAHGAEFDRVSGVCTLGPCRNQSLRAATVRVNNAGAVQWLPD
jgi:nitrite reductase/ring-hydroxylating ferredoxin subunit